MIRGETMIRKAGFWLKTGMVALVLMGPLSVSANNEELVVKQVEENVHAIVGPLGNRTEANLGNNATFGFVVTRDGVVLIDSGGTQKGARAIHEKIREVTDKSVEIVINTGGQDHRWLGNAYFKERGARIVASEAAVEDQRARFQDQMFMLRNLVGKDGLAGTSAIHAERTFPEQHTLELGGKRIVIRHVAPAHTPGDAFVWLPDEGIVFAGDIVFVDRLPGILEHSDTRGWIETFKAIEELEPEIVVPGHGAPTDMVRARAHTLDYLTFIREKIRTFMDEGGSITQVGKLDQSRFNHLENFDVLSGRNAQQVYDAMLWE